MLAGFPPRFPDETVYSMLCRLRKFLRIKSHAKFAKKMGKFRVNADLNFPIGFRQIEERTHQDWFTAEDAITNHSILPYHRRFNPEESYQRWRQDALEGKHGVSKSMGLNRFPPLLKACPLCIKADLEAGKKPGAETEPYYRRYHQLAGAEACFIHGLKLVALRVQNRTRLPYIPLADSLADFDVPPQPAHPVWVTLAKDLAESLKIFQDQGTPNFFKLIGGCLQCSENEIRVSDWRGVVKSYLQNASADAPAYLLTQLQPPLDTHVQKKGMNPAQCLVLLRACGLSPKVVADFEPAPLKPRRWTCINKLCTHHGEKVRELAKVFDTTNGEGRFFLKCPHCGQVTFQTRDRERRHQSTVTHILDFGPEWTTKFRSLWLDEKVSNNELERQLGLHHYTLVTFHAAYLNGLPLDRGGIEHRKKPLRQYLRRLKKDPFFEEARKQWKSPN